MKYSLVLIAVALTTMLMDPIWQTDRGLEYRFSDEVHADLEETLRRVRERSSNARPLVLVVQTLGDTTIVQISYIHYMEAECAIAPRLRRSESSYVLIGEERLPVLTEYDLRYTIDRACGKMVGELWWRPRTPRMLDFVHVHPR
jgi:hypothetical protein